MPDRSPVLLPGAPRRAARDRLLRWCAAAGMAVLLAACGSKVPLNDVPVEDRTPSALSTADAKGAAGKTDGSAVDSRNVAGVKVEPEKAPALPANLSRVVLFDFDSFIVAPQYASVIEGHARYLNADRKRKVFLEGHTDERGGREYNLALGQKRSEAVRRALSALGVSDAQMEAVSFGKEKPAMAGATEEAYSQNRRVEFAYR